MSENSSFHRPLGALLAALIMAFTLTACSSDDDVDTGQDGGNDALTVTTDNGRVAGRQRGAMREFLGIPYAAPPVSELRWKPPQPASSWSGVRAADTFASHCPQTASPFGTPSDSEDCLYLNVFAPQEAGSYPVMVWIHGGAFVYGRSDDFDPARLVAQDVVVVTINYRLGALGFLAHPALTGDSSDSTSGDYGLMDQQAALEWVQRNIANFGGDTDNVTIFGVSAGGLSVLSQITSPQASGLFDKAIVESGSYSLALPEGQPSLADAEAQGEAFASRAGCADQSLQCLNDLPVDDILANQGTSPTRFIPNTGNPVVPKSIVDALASGDFNQVPVIAGTNRNEWRLFVALNYDLSPLGPLTADRYLAAIQDTFLLLPEPLAQIVADQYPVADYDSPGMALAAAGTDGIFSCTGIREVGLLAQYVPAYAYEFADTEAPEIFLPPVESFAYGATHLSEVQYLFDFFDDANLVQPSSLDADQQALSQNMVGYWSQFARTGNPNPSSGAAPFWPQFVENGGTYLSLVAPEPMTRSAGEIGQEHQCGFWQSAFSNASP